MRGFSIAVLCVTVAACGCKKKTPPPPVAAAPAANAPEPGPAPAGGGNTNFQSGGGAVQNIRNAARRTITLNDMSQLGTLIEAEYTQNGRMPTAADIKMFLQKDAPHIAAAINDGSIILTGTSSHEGLWAYEVDADTKGGVVLVSGRATRADADEVKRYLGR
jgi:hypothetical protein